MKASQLFTQTSKNTLADEPSKNAQLLIKAGFVYKEMAGVYAYLPLGLMVIEKIKQIIREEMNAVGGQEMIMTNLQRKDLWQKTDRWDEKNVDIWFKTKLQNGNELGLAWSHEEPITEMMKRYITSYKNLPVYNYQFQTKLRNELRAKSGIMRGREFVMKDLYSYCDSKQAHEDFYDQMKKSYMNVFDKVGLGEVTYITYAEGGAFTKGCSHEFQTISDAGEDVVYVDRDSNIAINEEMYTDENLKELNLDKEKLVKLKAAEVGNIFSFGTSKTDELELYFTGENGERQSVYLGSYGIGVTRLMGVIVEHFADDKGLVWPEAVSPFKVYLAQLGNDEGVAKACQSLYDEINDKGIEAFWDDRDIRPGQKFGDADLYGFPYRIVVSNKTVQNNNYEVKKRTEADAEMLNKEELFTLLANQ